MPKSRQLQAGESLPASKEYLEKEVKNILVAFNLILNELIRDKSEELISPDLIRRFHRLVGAGLGDAFAAEPGSFRRKNVTVGNYRPPSFEEVPALVDKLCAWLDGEFHFRAGQSFEDAMIEAIVAHIYIEWIHPFGDGNGRTRRLLGILHPNASGRAECRVPSSFRTTTMKRVRNTIGK